MRNCTPRGAAVRRPVPASRPSMMEECIRVARLIVEDMGLHPDRLDRFWTAYLCDVYGGDVTYLPTAPFLSRHIVFRGACRCDDGRIYLSDALTETEEAVTRIHELAHRFQFSERYAELNGPQYAHFNKREFLESIAVAVEYMARLLLTEGWND